jgi:hypothetical protein
MGSDAHASTSSRKRPLPDDNCVPSAKRAAPDVPDFVARNPQLREQFRGQVKSWFQWYEALSSTADSSNQLVPFQGLLDGAKGALQGPQPRHRRRLARARPAALTFAPRTQAMPPIVASPLV